MSGGKAGWGGGEIGHKKEGDGVARKSWGRRKKQEVSGLVVLLFFWR